MSFIYVGIVFSCLKYSAVCGVLFCADIFYVEMFFASCW